MLQICHQQMARDTLMMRRAVVVGFLLVFGLAVRGSSVYRYEVDRGSDLEKELGYELSVHEEYGEKRTESRDKVIPVEGAAPKYTVKFHVPVADKLKDVFELALTVNDGNAMLAQVPWRSARDSPKKTKSTSNFSSGRTGSIRLCWTFAVPRGCRCPRKLFIPFDSENTCQAMRRQRRSESPSSAIGIRALDCSHGTAARTRRIIRITSAF